MAIFHFSVKAISRSAGRSAVACSAYRSGEKLEDHYQGKIQDYTQKTGVESKKIYAPENTKKELLDRQELWNTVEQVERRKDATLAREFEIAFPHEFNAEQRQDLLDELCQEIVEKHGVIVDDLGAGRCVNLAGEIRPDRERGGGRGDGHLRRV